MLGVIWLGDFCSFAILCGHRGFQAWCLLLQFGHLVLTGIPAYSFCRQLLVSWIEEQMAHLGGALHFSLWCPKR